MSTSCEYFFLCVSILNFSFSSVGIHQCGWRSRGKCEDLASGERLSSWYRISVVLSMMKLTIMSIQDARNVCFAGACGFIPFLVDPSPFGCYYSSKKNEALLRNKLSWQRSLLIPGIILLTIALIGLGALGFLYFKKRDWLLGTSPTETQPS